MFKCIKRKRLIKRVNECLGIQLRKDQIDYIFKGKPYLMVGRRNGKTLAHILRTLLNKGIYDFKILAEDEHHDSNYRWWYLNQFKAIYYNLKAENLVQCTIKNIEVNVYD